MKVWYKVVCDEHKQMIDIFVNNVSTTHHYLLYKDDIINNWLQLHYGCKLRFIHHDDEIAECFDKGYALEK